MTLLSIITVNLNNKKGLEKTLKSVVDQTFSEYEFIVIDANSNDGSKAVIERYNDKIDYWVSEPDAGIYNGMNKGLKQATGTYCLFLNSGDYLESDSILQDMFDFNLNADIIYGNLIFDYEGKFRLKTYPDKLDILYLATKSLPHPSMLIKKELFEKYGYYREDFKIISDWEFYLRLFYTTEISFFHFNKALTVFDTTGISSKDHASAVLEEKKVVYDELFDKHTKFLIEKNKENKNYNYKLVKLALKITQVYRNL